MKTFACGDIHGAHKALVQVLTRSGFDYEHDRFISLGDVADTWEEVAECVEELLKIKHLVAIAGNHDLWMKDFFNTREAHSIWLNQGGRESLDGYIRAGLINDERHIRFFNEQIPYFVDEANRLYVHGGFWPGKRIEMQDINDLAWDRSLWNAARDREKKGLGPSPDENGFTDIFIGHTPTIAHFRDDKPKRCTNVWNLDTGVKAGGRLTLMNVETKDFVQSDPVEKLYG